ncbi:MAG: NAD(P)-binding domain-containing protein [Nostoc sp.]|uniref:NADPH-dependent F420 reductase n=1 Tax=Nostoc sp. TaxID=1180 RepID=UPI002FF8F596
MKIGIIGAGFIGRTVASLAVKQDHQVMLSNSRGPETLTSTVMAIGCKAGTVEEAAKFGDIVVVAIPLKNYQSVPSKPLSGKIVVDSNNYYPERDGHIPDLDSKKTTTSELLAKHLPDSKVVKAFNAILAEDLDKDGRPSGSPDRRALPIAGDDADAKKLVSDLLDQFGFDVVDVGVLGEGWRFERAKPAYCVPLDSTGLKQALASADPNIDMPEGSWRH